MTAAKLAEINVLPTPGLAPEIIKTLFLASIIAKCKLVLRLRIASIARSAGLPKARSKFESAFFFCFLSGIQSLSSAAIPKVAH